MSDTALRRQRPGVENYVRLEMQSPARHEYVAGEVFALAGTSRRHNRIALNISTRLRLYEGVDLTD